MNFMTCLGDSPSGSYLVFDFSLCFFMLFSFSRFLSDSQWKMQDQLIFYLSQLWELYLCMLWFPSKYPQLLMLINDSSNFDYMLSVSFSHDFQSPQVFTYLLLLLNRCLSVFCFDRFGMCRLQDMLIVASDALSLSYLSKFLDDLINDIQLLPSSQLAANILFSKFAFFSVNCLIIFESYFLCRFSQCICYLRSSLIFLSCSIQVLAQTTRVLYYSDSMMALLMVSSALLSRMVISQWMVVY